MRTPPEGQIILAAVVAEPDPVIGMTVAALVGIYERSDCLPRADVEDHAPTAGAAP